MSLTENDRAPQSDGVTPSERFLARLARRSFLNLWCYPNLYTDEGNMDRRGNGKELCDLLVVFGDHLLLFSDKYCEFPSHTDIKVSWARWYRRAVLKSSRQLIGAESWIRRFQDRVFTDRSCTKYFPLPIPDFSKAKIHRIAVTRGSYEACRTYFGGGSTGSLLINTAIIGEQHVQHPFYIGHILSPSRYIHVFDELTLEVALRELDTISDFVSYLTKKEQLLTASGCCVLATGEEQLIANYLMHAGPQGEHVFSPIPPDVNAILFDEGTWEDFIRSPEYAGRKKADRISYAWDSLIERFTKHIIAGDIRGWAGNTDVAYHEQSLRVMASESRFGRRILAQGLIGAYEKVSSISGTKFVRMYFSKENPDTLYIFLILSVPDGAPYEDYRVVRTNLLLAYCKVAKLRAPQAKRILGFANEPLGGSVSSEDLLLLDVSNWSAEQESEARDLQREHGILLDENVQYYETKHREYPKEESNKR